MTLDDLERPKRHPCRKKLYGDHQKKLNENRPIEISTGVGLFSVRQQGFLVNIIGLCGINHTFTECVWKALDSWRHVVLYITERYGRSN